MPKKTTGKLRPGTIRVSYIEDKEIDTALDILSSYKRTNKSALIREATAAYLKRNDKYGVMKVSRKLIASLPDTPEERAKAVIDPETQAELLKILQAVRR